MAATYGRIRQGTITIGGSAKATVMNFKWNDDLKVDRSRADLELSGKPVIMSRGGSGSFELLAEQLASGYLTGTGGTLVLVYKEVTINLATGAETSTNKTKTFNGVTFETGGDIPPDAAGKILVNFNYAYIGDADPDA